LAQNTGAFAVHLRAKKSGPVTQGPHQYTKINHELQGLSADRSKAADDRSGNSDARIHRYPGNHHPVAGGGVDKFALTQIDADVINLGRGLKKEEVAGGQVASFPPAGLCASGPLWFWAAAC
jgi:hypothetical protein